MSKTSNGAYVLVYGMSFYSSTPHLFRFQADSRRTPYE